MAWHPIGWEPAFFSEIEKFPCGVLAHHYPRVPNLGDMTKFEEWPDRAIDLLVGGTPCQSFSVAGLRKGLADPRGNLMLTYLAIARLYRPRWLVWENVPGVLSSNGGRDFGTFVRGLEECGYHAAWRVLDAQYVRVDGYERAVPQRRRRVFVVGYLGDWRRAAAVLLEPEGLRGDSPPRREAGQGTSHDIAPSLVSSGRGVERAGDTRGQDPVVAINTQIAIRHEALGRGTGFGIGEDGDPAYTLTKEHHHAVWAGWAVRRLTPTECERLQGFPDSFTNIPWRGKPEAPDGPRYKALGNSMAVNAMRWIGQRIEAVEALGLGRAAA